MVGAPGFAVGWQEALYVPNPAAGADWSHVVDGRYYERLIAARWVLTTDAVAGNRIAGVQVTDQNGRVVIRVTGSGNIAASNAVDINLAVGVGQLGVATFGSSCGAIPDLLLPPGWSWSGFTFGLDAGDQESAVILVVQRFPNDAAVQPAEY